MPRSQQKPTVTDQDNKVRRFVAIFWFAHARGPTLREISAAMGWSAHGTAQRHVDALLRSGRLQRDAGGQLMTPGQAEVTPCLAVVLGGAGDEWIAAPAPNLIAWRVSKRGPQVRVGDVVFADSLGKAQAGELVLLKTGQDFQVAVLEGRIKRRVRPASDEVTQQGTVMEIRGAVRYILRALAAST